MGNITKRKSAKRGTRHQAEAWQNGKRKVKTFGTRAEAEAWIVATENTMGTMNTVPKQLLFRDVIERYQREVHELYPKKKRKDEEIRDLDKWLKHWVADIPLSELSADHANDIIRELRALGTVVDPSIERMLTPLRTVLKHCNDWYGMTTPWTGKKLLPLAKAPSRTRIIEQVEIDRLVEHMKYDINRTPLMVKQRIAAMFLFAIETGMRQGEIQQIKANWISASGKYVTLPAFATKDSKARNVPLSPKARKIIAGLPDCHPDTPIFQVTPRSVAPTFCQQRDAAGLPNSKNNGIRFHDSRHLATMRLGKIKCLSVGGELERMLGHKPPNMTATYHHEAPDKLADGIALHFEMLEQDANAADKMQALGLSAEEYAARLKAAENERSMQASLDKISRMLEEVQAENAALKAERDAKKAKKKAKKAAKSAVPS